MLRSLDAGLPKPRPSELGRGTLQSLLGLRQLCDLEACIQIYGKILHLDSLRERMENHGVRGRPIETSSGGEELDMNSKRGGLMLAGVVLILAVASGAWAAS